jgi:hypothetical protein
MINKMYLIPGAPMGWTIGFARVPEDGEEPEMEGFLAHFEKDRPDEKWLMVFRTQLEAKVYIVNNLPADALEGLRWACTTFTALDLLGFLREYPENEGVLFNPGSDEAHFVPAHVLIDMLVKALGELESDAA